MNLTIILLDQNMYNHVGNFNMNNKKVFLSKFFGIESHSKE